MRLIGRTGKNSAGTKQSAYVVPLALWAALALFAPLVGVLSSNVSFRGALEASTRDSLALSAPVLISAAPLIRVESGTLLLVSRAGEQVQADNTELLTSGRAHLVLDNAAMTVTGVDTSSTYEPTATGVPLLDTLTALKFETLELKHTSLALVLPDKGTETLHNVEASIYLRRGALQATGKGELRGERVDFDTTVALQADRRGQRNLPLKLRLRDENAAFDLDGRLLLTGTPQLQGQATLTVAKVRALARALGASWPSGPTLRDLAVKGDFDWTSTSMSFSHASFEMDGNAATGAMELNVAGPRLALIGTLAFKSLDLTPYVKTADGAETPFSWSSLATSQLKLPFGPLVDADVRISADHVTAGTVEFGRSAASVNMRDGKLQADIAELQVQGGRGMGQISADFSGYWPRLSLRGKLEDIDLGKQFSTVAGHSVIQGPTTIVADLSASGHVASDLLSSLNGKINVRSQAAGRIGADLRALLTAAQAPALDGWNAVTKAQTSYDQLELKLNVHDGVVRTEGSQIVAGQSTWTAEGEVDLPASRIDLKVLTGAAGRETSPSAVQAKPAGVEISGEIRTPAVKPLVARVTVPTAD